MLTYVSEPDADWGPARKHDRIGRYEPMNSKEIVLTAYDSDSTKTRRSLHVKNDNVNIPFESHFDLCTRF
jgi:hypothetical protein